MAPIQDPSCSLPLWPAETEQRYYIELDIGGKGY